MEKLINDEHGNFIIQQILKLKSDPFTKFIFDYTCENLSQLSKQKYSSNVVDKCILYEDDRYREIIIDKMISAKLIPELISDQFGNYGKYFKLIFRCFIVVIYNSEFILIEDKKLK